MKDAVIDHLCLGLSQKEACEKHDVKQPNLSSTAKEIIKTDDIVHELMELNISLGANND